MKEIKVGDIVTCAHGVLGEDTFGTENVEIYGIKSGYNLVIYMCRVLNEKEVFVHARSSHHEFSDVIGNTWERLNGKTVQELAASWGFVLQK